MVKIKISVLMSTYNPDERFFIQSVKSILNQTYKDFEFIIIDDGSNIDINETLERNNIYDNRIAVYKNDWNLGLPRSLNRGLKIANGEFIARMDDDDIAFPERLEKQYNFLKHNSKYIGVFSAYNIIDQNDNIITTINKKINNDNLLDYILYRGNFLCHSTAFIRKDILIELNGYDENLLYAQDYDLWIRILERYKMAFITNVLLNFRKLNNKKLNYYKVAMTLSNSIFAKYHYLLKNDMSIKKRIKFYFSILRTFLFYEFKTDIYKASK